MLAYPHEWEILFPFLVLFYSKTLLTKNEYKCDLNATWTEARKHFSFWVFHNTFNYWRTSLIRPPSRATEICSCYLGGRIKKVLKYENGWLNWSLWQAFVTDSHMAQNPPCCIRQATHWHGRTKQRKVKLDVLKSLCFGSCRLFAIWTKRILYVTVCCKRPTTSFINKLTGRRGQGWQTKSNQMNGRLCNYNDVKRIPIYLMRRSTQQPCRSG